MQYIPVGTTTKPLACAPGHTFQAHSLQMMLWGASLLMSPILSWNCYKFGPYTTYIIIIIINFLL